MDSAEENESSLGEEVYDALQFLNQCLERAEVLEGLSEDDDGFQQLLSSLQLE